MFVVQYVNIVKLVVWCEIIFYVRTTEVPKVDGTHV